MEIVMEVVMEIEMASYLADLMASSKGFLLDLDFLKENQMALVQE